MQEHEHKNGDGLDGALVLLVVGAHPRAEMHDRATAYRLRDRIIAKLAEYAARGSRPASEGSGVGGWTCIVVTDVWYLNDASLREWPVISVGGPSVNALTASLADRLPSAFVIDDVLMVQLDVEFEELIACVWGVSADATASATDVFGERYLDEFVGAAVRMGGTGGAG